MPGGRKRTPVLTEADRATHRRDALTNWSEAELRAEYNRLRPVANKRISRLEAAGFGDREVVRAHAGTFIPSRFIESKEELAAAVADVSRFLLSKISTVSGLHKVERKTVATLNEHGYDFVNESNLKEFGDFMQWARDTEFGGRGYKQEGSERIAQLYGKMKQNQQQKDDQIKKIKKEFQNYQRVMARIREKARQMDGSVSADKVKKLWKQYEKRHAYYLRRKARMQE